MSKRVVITGLGVAAPNGVGIAEFSHAIKNGISGIRHDSQLEDLQFSCQIAGTPQITDELKTQYFTELELRGFNSTGILYGVIAGIEAWKNAGLPVEINDNPDWDSGTIFGSGTSGIDKFRESIYKIDELQVRRLGSTVVAQRLSWRQIRTWKSSNHKFICLRNRNRSYNDGLRPHTIRTGKTHTRRKHRR